MVVSEHLSKFFDRYDYMNNRNYNSSKEFIIDLKILRNHLDEARSSIKRNFVNESSDLVINITQKIDFFEGLLTHYIRSIEYGGVGQNENSRTVRQIKDELEFYIDNNFSDLQKK